MMMVMSISCCSHSRSLHALLKRVLRQQLPGVRIQHGRPLICPGKTRPLVTFPSSQKTSIVEHVLSHRVQGPVIAFAWIARFSWYFDKTIIQWKIVTDGVLPCREFFTVIGKPKKKKLSLWLILLLSYMPKHFLKPDYCQAGIFSFFESPLGKW